MRPPDPAPGGAAPPEDGSVAARVAELELRLRERDGLVLLLRGGLAELAAELDALRLLATTPEAAGPARPSRARGPQDPSVRMGELARGARELLAGGRIDAADEVIRGLEDAAARLRAQSPPPGQE